MQILASPNLNGRFVPMLALALLAGVASQPAAGQAATGQHLPAGRQPATPYSENGAIPMPSDRAADSYAIYSMLMPGEPFNGMAPDQTARWAIAEITVNAVDRNPAVPPQGQLKPPPDDPRGFNEAVADYQTNRNLRVRLAKDQLRISHDFDLLSPDQVNDLRDAKSGAQVSSDAQAQWSGVPGITYFSAVYFDTKHAAALVYMNDWCAHLCPAGTWVYLEKHGGHWVRRSGVVSGGA
jgi:hypothetical protein